MLETPLPRLHATRPAPLPFATTLHIRAFVLEREAGNLLVYAAPTVAAAAPAIDALGGVERQYLNHWHEAAFGGDGIDVPLVVHADDRDAAAGHRRVDATFSERAVLDGDLELIPTPGHTPGATAFLWDSGEGRLLFTGDSLYIRDGEWVAAVLDSSDRAAYAESLERIRGLEFDALVPWAASADGPPYARTDPDDARRRLDAVLERIRRGEDH